MFLQCTYYRTAFIFILFLSVPEKKIYLRIYSFIHQHHENWFIQRVMVLLSSFVYPGLDFLWAFIWLPLKPWIPWLLFLLLSGPVREKGKLCPDSGQLVPDPVRICQDFCFIYCLRTVLLFVCLWVRYTSRFKRFVNLKKFKNYRWKCQWIKAIEYQEWNNLLVLIDHLVLTFLFQLQTKQTL